MAKFLKFLEDGGWHKLSEFAKQTGQPLNKLESYSQALTKHGILEYDPATSTVRLSQEIINLIIQLRAEENATPWEKLGAATIIVPPEKSFQIQKVTLHNLTEQDLQFELKFNTKLKEIAVTQA